jgi:nucleoside-diphosphate-sugar epimerase
MATLAPATGAKVLVTGANGYIAIHVVDQLLKAGYAVRGTVRSEKKTLHLKQVFAGYGDKLELIIVDDITRVRLGSSVRALCWWYLWGQEGVFDDAVKGVDALAHMASPLTMNWDDPQGTPFELPRDLKRINLVSSIEAIGPALKGTTSVLNSILKYGYTLLPPFPSLDAL